MNRRYISVFSLNKYIKAKMDQDVSLQNVYIKGEISNYRPHPSGHLYFTLKDNQARVSAVMFASQAKQLKFVLENGMQVLLQVNVSAYEVTGQYQLYVQTMEPDGKGDLFLQFELLKKKLESEGLFDKKNKKEIPKYPRSIAVASAKQGAALQDIIRTIHLRFPFTKVVIFPIPVQGKDAYLSIVKTLKHIDKIGFDTIIIGRGGGSIEDLWNFNEEQLVRCLFELKTPIITGIGHETDFTICDFVSDYRGATPTAAATKATPDQFELKKYSQDLTHQLIYKMKHFISHHDHGLKKLKDSYYLRNPQIIYSNEMMRLSQLQDQLTYQFNMFDMLIMQELLDYQKSLKQTIDYQINTRIHHQARILTQLDALSPLKVMKRGYTFVRKEDTMIKSVHDLSDGDDITIQFYDGIKNAKIK